MRARLLYNERKHQTLAYFSRRGWTRPQQWSADAGLFPVRGGNTYLLRLHRWGLLARGYDFRGRVVYRLSPRGARWLLRRERGE